MIIKSYGHRSGAHVEVHKADIFEIKADLMIMGKNRELKRRLE